MIQPGSTMSPGVMMASVILVGRALMPLESMIGSYRNMLDAFDAYKEMDEVLKSMNERPRLTVVRPARREHLGRERHLHGSRPRSTDPLECQLRDRRR